jgi:hypothetical protein
MPALPASVFSRDKRVRRGPGNRLGLVVLTDAQTGLAHLVRDEEAAQTHLNGRCRAVCGVTVLASSLAAPEGVACPQCARWRRGELCE